MRSSASGSARRCGGRTARPSGSPARTGGHPPTSSRSAAIAFELLTGRRPSGTGRDIGPLTGATVPTPTPSDRARAGDAEDPATGSRPGSPANALAPRRRAPTLCRERLGAEAAASVEGEPPADRAGHRMIASPNRRSSPRNGARRARAALSSTCRRPAVAHGPAVTEPNRPTGGAGRHHAEREEDEATGLTTTKTRAPIDRSSARRRSSPDDVEPPRPRGLRSGRPDACGKSRSTPPTTSPVQPGEARSGRTRRQSSRMTSPARTRGDAAARDSLPRASMPGGQRRSRSSSARSVRSAHEADERVPFEHFAGAPSGRARRCSRSR